ncbi:MAG: hypothetical protein ACREJ2_02305, partial [Planctomycetota bacterium]
MSDSVRRAKAQSLGMSYEDYNKKFPDRNAKPAGQAPGLPKAPSARMAPPAGAPKAPSARVAPTLASGRIAPAGKPVAAAPTVTPGLKPAPSARVAPSAKTAPAAGAPAKKLPPLPGMAAPTATP